MEGNHIDFKKILKQNGLTQTRLAQKLGISRQHLHDILKLNRKSKYSEQIFTLLQQGRADAIPKLESDFGKNIYKTETLPMIFIDDLIRMYSGDFSLNLLQKPFYIRYPVINFTETQNDFCLRLSEMFTEDSLYMSMGVFRLSISLNLKKGQIILLYLNDSKKVVMGRIEIDPHTHKKCLINDRAFYMLAFHDILLAECTQVVHFLP